MRDTHSLVCKVHSAACRVQPAALLLILLLLPVLSLAEDIERTSFLRSQVSQASSSRDAYQPLEELKDAYLGQFKYNEFIDYLNSLEGQQKELVPLLRYYKALTRYRQLRYLEETQGWEEYFNSGNAYREEILRCAREAVDSTTSKEIANVYARLLLWQQQSDLRDSSAATLLTELLNALFAYERSNQDPLPIKEVANQLMAYGETAKAKELYHLYIGQLVAAEIKDEEIRAIALDFYNLPAAKALAVEGIPPQYQLPADSSVFPPAEIEKRMNLELAEAVYDVYIKRAMRYPKEQFLAALSEIACSFAATSKGMSDPAYAESVFKKIEDRLGQNALSEELTYLRALNLERAGEFEKAVSCYRDLLKYYPLTARANEVNFKLGMIYGYLLRDIKSAENYFSGLASAEAQDVYQMQALYQLGLLSQWQEDTAAAGAYYDRLIAQAKEDYPEIVELALKRKKEMEENSSLEYNLKLFLDTSFKDEYAAVPLKNSLLSAEPFIAAPAEKIKVSSLVSRPDTGCLQLDLQYLWSGNTGTARPMSGENSFETSYASAGTKEINLLVVSASGILSRNIEFIDIR